jgi:hypothetical protein
MKVRRSRFIVVTIVALCSFIACKPSPKPCAPGTVNKDGSGINGCECTVSAETCDLEDNDCDGAVDEGVQSLFYQDQDGDGFGGSVIVQACSAPVGFVSKPGDCQDFDANTQGATAEVCNQLDDDCDGQVDEGMRVLFYQDQDGDGFGGPVFVQACSTPPGFVSNPGDCQDFNASIYPSAAESCNLADDNCNGRADEGLATIALYRDNDGDGIAASNTVSQHACQASTEWVPAKDVDSDGKPDWDCNDADTTTYPGAPEVCGDSRDNTCSGYVDRICYSTCDGRWPFRLSYSLGNSAVRSADLNGDGHHEVIVNDSFGFALLDHDGSALLNYSAPVHNYGRGVSLVADIDDYDQYGPGIQSLEILTVNGSTPRYYKLLPNRTVTQYASSASVYDASTLLASDLDRDGKIEFLTGTGCEASGTKIFRFDRTRGAIDLAGSIPAPQGKCQYYPARTLTDLNGDGTAEFVFGNGYPYATDPSLWAGKLFAYRINPTTLGAQPYCPEGVCFNTDIAGLHSGGITSLFRFGTSLRASNVYYTANVPNAVNPSTYRIWEYDLNGSPTPDSPGETDTLLNGMTDVDRDGIPENFTDVASTGLFDVNSDGYPDRIYVSGSELRLSLWDPFRKAFIENVSSRARLSNSALALNSIWDLDADGRLDVLSSDASGNIHCQELGYDTWNKLSSVPPMPIHLNTRQWDNYEPNEGRDSDADGLPDEVVRIPSALTAKGDFYGYLSSVTDKDYYLVDADWGAAICVTAPLGNAYTLKVYSFADRWNNSTHVAGTDGVKDGLVWTDASGTQTKCFSHGLIAPYRSAEYKFIIGIEARGGSFSPYWPYWISTPK